MPKRVVAAVSTAVFVAIATSTALLAQQAAPKVEETPRVAPAEAAKTPADPDAVAAPDQLRSKSVIVNYFETRNARPEGGRKAETRRVPFTLIVYINKDKHAFNRLVPGRSGASSDQVRGAKDEKGSAASKDITGFATRDVAFDGLKMTVSNRFGAPARGGGWGLREISATFDETFTKCTGNVVTTIEGEYARRRMIKGGFEEVLSATNDGFTCAVLEGNALAGGS